MGAPVRVVFGQYKPDVPAILNDGLTVAKNTVPVPGDAYSGISTPTDIDDFSAMDERCRGSISGIDPAGNPYTFSGDETNLYQHRESTSKVSLVDDSYNCKGQNYWEMVVFGSQGRHHVIAVTPGNDSQYFTVGESETFAQLGNPDATMTVAPRAKTVGVIGSIVMLGNTVDRSSGRDQTAVHWSALNDPFNWPVPGSSVAIAVQSGRQPLAGDGGAVQRVVSGAEVGAVFQERSVWRVDYRGGDEIFGFERVEPNRGVLIPSICVPFGRNIFYLSEDGFYLFDYTTSTPVGRGRIDRTFLADVDESYFDRVSAVPDPDNQRVWILYPGSGNTSGTPNKVLIYDWGLDRYTHADIDAEWITMTSGLHRTLDSPGTAADPDDTSDNPTTYPLGGVDGPGLPSFDERIAAPGALKLAVFSTSHRLQDFTGAGMTATLETGRRELIPGSRSLVSSARVIVDGVNPTVQTSGLGRINESLSWSEPSAYDLDDGDNPLREDARYHCFRLNMPSGFSDGVGMDVTFQRSGSR